MRAYIGPLAQRLSAEAIYTGLVDRLATAGFSKPRLIAAAESKTAGEGLTTREVTGLAYGLGLTAGDAALLAYGNYVDLKTRVRPQQDRIERLMAGTDWWGCPTTRVSDLGEGTYRRMLGAMVGLDLKQMDESTPLPVPADTRYAALADFEIGSYWELDHGLRDGAWIEELNTCHQQLATSLVPNLSKDQVREMEEDREAYHLVSVPPMSIQQAADAFGTGVSMVLAMGPTRWGHIFIHPRKEFLWIKLGSLNSMWVESTRQAGAIASKEIKVRSLGEVGEAVMSEFSNSGLWKVIALRFPGQPHEAAGVIRRGA